MNEYSKNGGHHHHHQQKPRVPKLRRMSAAAFNFLSNNIAPKWLADKLADGGEATDDPRHRLSLNDDHGHGYGSTYNGTSAFNHHYQQRHNNRGGGGIVGAPHNPVDQGYRGHYHGYSAHQHRGSYTAHGLGAVYAPVVPVQQLHMASAAPPPEQPRARRLSSPDPVLAHCANTFAVADFLMTLQRSLDKTYSTTVQPSSAAGHAAAFPYLHRAAAAVRQERRSPLFTLFQDRRASSSAESWQYSSLTSTVSSSTAAAPADATAAAADATAAVHPVNKYIYTRLRDRLYFIVRCLELHEFAPMKLFGGPKEAISSSLE